MTDLKQEIEKAKVELKELKEKFKQIQLMLYGEVKFK